MFKIFKQKPIKRIYKIHYFIGKGVDETRIYFDRRSGEDKYIEAYDQFEAIGLFYKAMEAYQNNLMVDHVNVVIPVKS